MKWQERYMTRIVIIVTKIVRESGDIKDLICHDFISICFYSIIFFSFFFKFGMAIAIYYGMTNINHKGAINMKTNMPIVDMEKVRSNYLSEEETNILNVVVKKDSSVRASKPNVKGKNKDLNGKASYVWRMVAFMVSKNPVHQCMPVCASFDIPAYDEDGKWRSEIARRMEKELDVLVDMIVDAIDKTQWAGVHRWGKALGY